MTVAAIALFIASAVLASARAREVGVEDSGQGLGEALGFGRSPSLDSFGEDARDDADFEPHGDDAESGVGIRAASVLGLGTPTASVALGGGDAEGEEEEDGEEADRDTGAIDAGMEKQPIRLDFGTFGSGSVPAKDSELPELGLRGAKYEVTGFLALGGQAEVWIGRVRRTDKPVVFRFPRGMCEDRWCRIHELHQDTLAEWHSACSLSHAAVARHKARFRKGADGQRKRPKAPFAKCRLPLAVDGDELAFEVWSFIRGVTMAEAFFTRSALGEVGMAQKREALAAVADAVVTLAGEDSTFASDWLSCCGLCCGTHSRKIARGDCPEDLEGQPKQAGACGPMVHHDIKFDNVMVDRVPSLGGSFGGDSASNSSDAGDNVRTKPGIALGGERMQIALVDFGGAASCASHLAPAFTQEWVPFWIKDGRRFSPTECWSYDTYTVGLAWLVTELLAEMPAAHLLCLAALGKGLVQPSDMTNSTAGGVNAVHSCGDEVPTDWVIIQQALQPVSALVREVATKVLTASPEVTKDARALHGALQRFVASRDNLAREVQALPLSTPSLELLQEHIFPMIRECPDFPGPMAPAAQGRFFLTRCRCEAAGKRLRRVQREEDPEMAMVSLKQTYGMSSVEYIPEMMLVDMEPKIQEAFTQVIRECPTKASAA